MQTFVFSATLSKDLQQNLKRRIRRGAKKGAGKKMSAFEDLVDRLDFREPNPEVIDLSPQGGVVATLKESMVECVVADKVCAALFVGHPELMEAVGPISLLFPSPLSRSITRLCRYHRRYSAPHALVRDPAPSSLPVAFSATAKTKAEEP